MVRIYNTLTRRKDEIRPANADGRIRLYECGLTPYDEPHIGHARTAIVFDVLKRWLEYRGMKVVHVKNVTDIEDRIIERAAKMGISISELVGRFDPLIRELFLSMGLKAPDHEPYATKHIPEIIGLIAKLEKAGLAYAAGGDVYYPVRKFAGYGTLSGRSLDELLPGARIEPGEMKRDPLDFALWKGAKPGEPAWESPWGLGRPGWHIECSAMAMKYLGETLDIHGGGNDLIFPHHENEIAQSEGATGKPFARIWVHVGFVTLNQEKMSKSLGNVLALREVLSRMPSSALRLLMCQTHYRSPFEYSQASEVQARETLESLRRILDLEGDVLESGADQPGRTSGVGEIETAVAAGVEAFDSAMDDDLGTPQALAGLFKAGQGFLKFRQQNRSLLSDPAILDRLKAVRDSLLVKLNVLGILTDYRSEEVTRDIRDLVKAREEARTSINWKRADEVREEIRRQGWILEDTPDGARVRRAS